MKKTIVIEGMTCSHCEGHVKKELEAICGVTSAEVSAEEGTAVVDLAHEVDEAKFKAAVEDAGYEFVEVN